MQLEERLRSHLAEHAEAIDVPPRHVVATPIEPVPGGRAFATGVAVAVALVAVIGVSFASNRPAANSDLLDLNLPDAAALLPPGSDDPSSITFDWQRSSGVEATELAGMSDGTVVAFSAGDTISQRGLRVWTLQRDGAWSGPRQAAGLAYQPTAVQADSEIVAMAHGSPWAFQFPELTGGTLLLSSDGQNWSERALPMVTDPPHAVADLVLAGGGRVLLRTEERSDAAARIWNTIGADYASSTFSFDLKQTEGGDQALVINDLELAIEAYPEGGSGEAPHGSAKFWASNDYETWTEVMLPDVGPNYHNWTGFYHEGVYVVIAAATDGDQLLLTSPDLVSWETVGAWEGIESVGPMDGGGYVATRRDRPGLYVSEDLVRWQPLEVLDGYTLTDQSNVVIDSGPIGVALAVTGPEDAPFNAAASIATRDAPDSVVIFRSAERTFTLLSPDFSSARRIEYSETVPSPYIVYDPERDALQFSDPITGEAVAEVGSYSVLDALRTIETSRNFESSLLFGSASEGWSTVDLADELGVRGPVTDVLVTQDSVVVAFGASPGGPAQVWIGTPVAR